MSEELNSLYTRALHQGEHAGVALQIVETDIDLYYHMAFSMYCEIERLCSEQGQAVLIAAVGPVFQYRRLVELCRMRPLALDRVHWFFMDEYLDRDGQLIDENSPLSFRGFIRRELVEPMPAAAGLRCEQIHFPDPADSQAYEGALESLGEADVCYAGVGITGHLAFNDPPEPEEEISAQQFADSVTRVVSLSRETITINSNTALRGAIELVPRRAVTVGMRRILASRKLRIYLNRPWQSAVVRRFLFGPETVAFPVSLARRHRDVGVIITSEVARAPDIGLR